MNDAISRALGRAGELEALVHNEVSALERSYEENERKIRGLIQELSGERHALLNTSERVTDTLRTLGTDVPALIDKLSASRSSWRRSFRAQARISPPSRSAVGQSTNRLESALGSKTEQLQNMLEGYTSGLANGAGRTHGSPAGRNLRLCHDARHVACPSAPRAFRRYSRSTRTRSTPRSPTARQALDFQLVERTKVLDAAFGQRLKNFDEQIVRSTMVIDNAVAEKARALTAALDNHAKSFSDTISRQAIDLDEVTRARYQLRAPHQREHHTPVSEGDRGPVQPVRDAEKRLGKSPVANWHRQQSLRGPRSGHPARRDIARGRQPQDRRHAAGAPCGAVTDHRPSRRQSRRSSAASSRAIRPRSRARSPDAEARARATAEELRKSAELSKHAALQDLERFRVEAGAEGDRALDDLRRRASPRSPTS